MNVLQIVSHPDTSGSSFTQRAAKAYRAGLRDAQHKISSLTFFNELPSIDFSKELITAADHIAFHWPCWWEMPPYPLVQFLQTVLVKDFAFRFEADGSRTVLLDIPTTTFISMGQRKTFHTDGLADAMDYCGLRPRKFHIFENVGALLSKELEDLYFEQAYNAAYNLKGR
jgi:putative NADPH-quinone reductase